MKKYIIPFLLSFLLFFICTPLRNWGLINASIIETICYSIITYLVLRRCSSTNKETLLITGLIILGRIILELPLRIVDFKATLISLPGTLLACLAIVLTSLVFNAKRKMYISIFSLVVGGFCIFVGHRYWLEYVTFEPIPKVQVASFTIRDSTGNTTLGDIENKYILLDFWNSKCSICYKKFPNLQKLYENRKDKIIIASVFVPFKNEQQAYGQTIIDKYGYTFPVWSVTTKDTLLSVLEINRYPTVILLDKNKNVLFKGNLEKAENKLESLID